MARARKRQDLFVYEGFGFPVAFVNVPMVLVRGDWTPDVNYTEIARRLLRSLVLKPARLTGHEVRFIRHMMKMNLKQFGKRFGVTHPAVLKWEKTRTRPTAMTWAVEKDMRLEILHARKDAGALLAAYDALVEEPTGRPERMRLQLGRPA